jgi:hypothetical protein
MSNEEQAQDLDFTQNLRKKIIAKKLGTEGIPTNDDDIVLVGNLLNDMDRATLGRMKIKVDEGAGKNAEQALAIMSSLFEQKDINFKKMGMNANLIREELPVLEIDGSGIVIVPGEMDSVAKPETYDDFTQRMGMKTK